MRRSRVLRLLLAGSAVVLASCAPAAVDETPAPSPTVLVVERGEEREFPPAPAAPSGSLSDADRDKIQQAVGPIGAGSFPFHADVSALADIGDVRVAWILADMLRIFADDPIGTAAREAVNELTGQDFTDPFSWTEITDLLIAWDLPAFPSYVTYKRQVIGAIEPAWQDFFGDEDADIDWRVVSWGGVRIDDRALDAVDEPCPRGCIPAWNDPTVTDAAGGDWYPDDAIVFGVVVGDEARAYPKHQMEVHEMVNDELGGRRIAIPYCTLCGAAQVWFTDVLRESSPPRGSGGGDGGVGSDIRDSGTRAGFAEVLPDGASRLEMRTSGLLSRSNKVMYEFHTRSVFDTFTGRALSGPLQDLDVQLEQGTVVTATWGEWKTAHPDTTILTQGSWLRDSYDLDPLDGRDDDGPIFPIGATDASLDVHEQVLGVLDGDRAVAFPVDAARAALAAGRPVAVGDVAVTSDGAGLVATVAGVPVASHQAFWFAWSQFHPDTELWLPS